MIRSPGPQRIFAAHAVGHNRAFRVTPRKRPTRRRLSKKPSARRRSITVINPATGEVRARHPSASAGHVRAAVEKARVAFRSWSRLAPTDRAAYLSHLAEILRKHRDDYARTMTLEMGKVIREANAEVDKCAWAADVFAKEGPRFLDPEPVETEAMKAYIAFDPRGVLGSIMPWNFPMWQIVRFAVPALMAGNTAVVHLGEAFTPRGLRLRGLHRAVSRASPDPTCRRSPSSHDGHWTSGQRGPAGGDRGSGEGRGPQRGPRRSRWKAPSRSRLVLRADGAQPGHEDDAGAARRDVRSGRTDPRRAGPRRRGA